MRVFKSTVFVLISIIIFSLAVFSVETGAEKTDTDVLVRIGDEVITKSDLESALKKMPENKRQQFRDKTLDKLIEVKVFSSEARKAGLDRDPQVREKLEKSAKETLANFFIKKYIDVKAEPSEEEIKEYYSEHKNQFVIPDGVFIQHILVKKQEDAHAILEELKRGESFEALAKNKSIAGSSKNEGRLGWLYKGRMHPELEKVAFNLKKGQLSDVIKTAEGYEIIKVLKKSDRKEITFEEAKTNIRYQLFDKKKKELEDKYFEEARVNKNPHEKGVLFKIGEETFKEKIIAPPLAGVPEKEKEKVRRRMVDYLIETTVFSREARKAGLEKDAEIAGELKRRTEEILADSYIKKFIEGKIHVSDSEIADYYQSHPEEFSAPLPVNVKIKFIVVKTKEEAENILKELKEGATFDALVGDKGGESGWFGKGEKGPEVEKAAFSLKEDTVSGAIKTADGYQIIKVIDKRGGGAVRSLGESKRSIKNKLRMQRFQDEKQRYYEKAGVKILK
jgi:EpsD family peptidyl-prolyl cis-trans isomerase